MDGAERVARQRPAEPGGGASKRQATDLQSGGADLAAEALWTWRDGRRTGNAVVFDLDGVLSDAAARQHLVRGPKPDWEAFFAASGEDPLVEEVAALLGLLGAELSIVLLTARPARAQPSTVRWLEHHGLRWDLLLMRPEGDHRPARVFKQVAVRAIQTEGLRPMLCFEDDQRNVEMFRSEGVPCVYIHSGYYE
jgi:hypothetical protein